MQSEARLPGWRSRFSTVGRIARLPARNGGFAQSVGPVYRTAFAFGEDDLSPRGYVPGTLRDCFGATSAKGQNALQTRLLEVRFHALELVELAAALGDRRQTPATLVAQTPGSLECCWWTRWNRRSSGIRLFGCSCWRNWRVKSLVPTRFRLRHTNSRDSSARREMSAMEG